MSASSEGVKVRCKVGGREEGGRRGRWLYERSCPLSGPKKEEADALGAKEEEDTTKDAAMSSKLMVCQHLFVDSTLVYDDRHQRIIPVRDEPVDGDSLEPACSVAAV